MANLICMPVKLVVNIQNRSAGIPENGIHALLLQTFNQDLGTVQFHTSSSAPGVFRIAPLFPDVTIAA